MASVAPVTVLKTSQLAAMGAPYNPRKIAPRELESLRQSMREFGVVQPIVVNKTTGRIVGGHQRVRAAEAEGIASLPVVYVELDDIAEKQLNLALNRIGGDWDETALAGLLADMRTDEGFRFTGFDDAEIEGLLAKAAATAGLTDPDDAPEVPVEAATQRGDLIVMGRHRLLCGDCTGAANFARLLGDAKPDLVLTDPPYCSGGFQESGRSTGSVGTTARHKQIANDRLSSRGYMALLKAALVLADSPLAYVFTDWRMWVYLFDVVESSGYGVRSMVVWDKQTPGMGRGWRSQHELVMFASKSTAQFGKHTAAKGNVIQARRTGNHLHTTEKPVDVVAQLLEVCSFAKVAYDPFAGSGTTLIAAETQGISCYLTELDPAYCDVIAKRWQDFTGKTAEGWRGNS